MLEVKGLTAGYGDLMVLHDVSLHVNKGEVVGLIGANGAGKSTLMSAIMGGLPVSAGEVVFLGASLGAVPSHKVVGQGLVLVPEGRALFPYMSVEENLELGALSATAKGERRASLEKAYTSFPILYERRRQTAITLSGGEQQMLAIGRALMALPRMLLLDEPSLALAPLLIEQIFLQLESIVASGVTILIAEQNVSEALELSDRAYVLEQGEITLEGPASVLLKDDRIREAFLGI